MSCLLGVAGVNETESMVGSVLRMVVDTVSDAVPPKPSSAVRVQVRVSPTETKLESSVIVSPLPILLLPTVHSTVVVGVSPSLSLVFPLQVISVLL